ncbi:MAG: TldD/PmbA family protein [Candidatus Zixiibacteriota bacterium]|nr:MAG: TldD/PmbA family protein [candidate division Zixibacteria bacterium]
MNNKEKLELARWAVEQAKFHGAEEVSVDVAQSRNVEVEYRDGQLDKLKESTQNALDISFYDDNRYSSHGTNDLRKESLEKFISGAVAMTKYLNEDPHRKLPDPEFYKGQKDIDLKVFDSSYESVTSEQRVQISKEIESIARAQSDKILSCTAGYSDSFSQSVKVNSNGFEGESSRTAFSAGAEATVDDGEGGRPYDWNWATVRLFKDLPDLEFLGKVAVERALEKIGQDKMESGKYDMVVENRSAGRLFYSLFSPMQASSLQQKSSFLEGRLGEKIASGKFTLIDDPFIVNGLGSRLYDGEGMATKKRVKIDKGVLKEYYIDNYYGNKLGMAPNSGSTSNLTLEYGTKSLDDLIKEMKKGILVKNFIGGNSNSTTGDFSIGIVGLYVEDGRIVRPVNEMNISGNMNEFWNRLAEVGNDPYIYSSWRFPSLYFTDVQFSGI